MKTMLLKTEGLRISFGGVHAVQAVDFELSAGEIRFLIGPNGAGKSTFFKLLTGQLSPTRGSCHFKGQKISGLPSHRVARMGIGIKTQNPSVFDGLDAHENLRLAAALQRANDECAAIVADVLARTRLTDLASRTVGDLAHGQRQWRGLGMILASRPERVLLDEPAAGMSHHETRITPDLIKQINKHSTVVVVEHDMDFIEIIVGTVTSSIGGRYSPRAILSK